jgi:tetratricopeptide (TPR) repeat protein
MIRCPAGSQASAFLISLLLASGTPAFAREDLENLSFFPQPLHAESPESLVPAPSGAHQTLETGLANGHNQTSPDASIGLYQEQISQIQTLSGPFDTSLIQPYQSLASLYQNSGDLPAAIDMLDKQLQVIRINQGLYATEQSSVLRSLVNTYVEAGDLDAAHAYQEALFNLEMRAHGKDSLAFVASRLEWADWNMNHYLSLGPGAGSVGAGMLEDPRITIAYDNYVAALEVLQNYARYADERMVTTERKLAALNFIINRKMHKLSGEPPTGSSVWQAGNKGQQKKLEQADTAHFFNGSSALKRAIVYSSSAPQPDYDFIAQRMLELGDWYLLFDRRAAAIDVYNNALEVLIAANLPEQEINRILSAGLPVQTPDLTWQRQVTADQYAGFIDVEFELSKYGTASNPQILSSTEQDSRIERELIRTIRNCKFRPMFADGTAVDNEKVKLRYYYTL